MAITEKLNNLWTILQKEPLTVVFLLVLLTSLVWHEAQRNQHFQECDSAGVYNMIYDFPGSALAFVAQTSLPGHIISPQTAQKILDNKTVAKLVNKYFGKYPKSEVADRISKLNVFAVIHYGYIEAINLLHLPHQLQGFFSVPLGSTYSAGPGLFYSLITGPQTSYESFISRITFVDILLFHLAVLWLYLICRHLKINNNASIIGSVLMLFSISYYSSGLHLGSTVWNVASEILLLWIVVKYWDKENFLKILSYCTAVLVFFNYLIIFLWAAILLALLYQKLRGQKLTFKNFWAQACWPLIKSQWAGIIFITLCGILFFVPGQSNRGSTNYHTLPSDLYYIVLNFFSFYTHSKIWNIIQFILGLFIIIATLRFLFSKNSSWDGRQILKNTLAWFFVIFWLLILVQILGLVPTRHLLFLAPIWFLGLALALDAYLAKIMRSWAGAILIILIVVAGFYSLKVRAADVLDRTAGIALDSDLSEAGVNDCSYNLTDRAWHSPVPVVFINPNQFSAGKNYLYLSQTTPFAEALINWQQQYNLQIQILNETDESNPVYFVAYNPDFRRLSYSRPNSLYETKFKVLSVSKK